MIVVEGKQPDLLLLTGVRAVTFHANSKNPLLSFLTEVLEGYQTPSVLSCGQAEDNLSHATYLNNRSTYLIQPVRIQILVMSA